MGETDFVACRVKDKSVKSGKRKKYARLKHNLIKRVSKLQTEVDSLVEVSFNTSVCHGCS